MENKVDFKTFWNIINGEKKTGPETNQTLDPSTKTLLWTIPVANSQDTENAIDAAQNAFREWSQRTWTSRQDVLCRMRATLLERQEDMAKLLTLEGGKPVQYPS